MSLATVGVSLPIARVSLTAAGVSLPTSGISLPAASVPLPGAGVSLPAGYVECDVEENTHRDHHPHDETDSLGRVASLVSSSLLPSTAQYE